MSEAIPLRVLLVDDEVGFTDVLAKRLRRRGLAVEVAQSGAEGLRLLRESDFDAAVCDLKMVDMDGIEVLKVFRKMVPAMPVIMLTGHGSEEAAKDGMQAGAAAVIANVVINMAREIFRQKHWKPIAMMALAFVAAVALKINVVIIILACGVIGAVDILLPKKKKEDTPS